MKKVVFLIVVSVLLFGFDLSKSTQKKIDKTIASLWENITISKTFFKLTAAQKTTFKLNDNELLYLKNGEELVGYLYLAKADSRSDKIDYMVIFKPDLTILSVKILVYREDYGGEVGSRRWLKQFIGKTDGKEMKFGYNIQNISGATISARSMTQSVNQVSKNMVELKNQGAL
jgi:Na+-translocating ferredoxin:NAD+ oxidoreductase RnfG subunit